eukprot:PITA_06690
MNMKVQSLYIDSQHEANTDLEACEIETPQVSSHDPWYQIGLVLITSLNSAYALGYSGIVMVPLGWAIYTLHNNEAATLKLPYCIAITGIICSIFAFGIPHLSALRLWLSVSTFFSCIYIIAAIGLSMRDGLNSPARDYEISSSGSSKSRMFGTIGAAANLIFAFNSGMLPEIQATIKHPSVKNMQKALSLQFTAGIVPFYAVTFIGYLAYGSSTSSYLLNNVHEPKWIKILANAAVFFQTDISLHPHVRVSGYKVRKEQRKCVFCAQLDSEGGGSRDISDSDHTCGALLPFVGDFMNITGAVNVIPLTFVLANHMYIKLKGKDLSSLGKTWHWANIWFFAFLSVIATVAAFRFMVIDSRAYNVFADL